jgi:hypothetical protein
MEVFDMTEFILGLMFGGLIVGVCTVVCLDIVKNAKAKSENREKLLERLRCLT